MKWLWLSLGIFFEIIALIFMKKSEGFSKLLPVGLVILFDGLSLACLFMVLKKMDTSIVYAIWASAGILIMSLIGILWLQEPVSVGKVASMLLIVAGVIGLELFA